MDGTYPLIPLQARHLSPWKEYIFMKKTKAVTTRKQAGGKTFVSSSTYFLFLFA